MDHRSEIDGLRAIAVLPVLFFHAGIEAFSGGFVGVDVFFVISGYLITSLIAADLSKGAFSVSGFYERRIRRIIPALFLVVGVSAAYAPFALSGQDRLDFYESVIATTVFSSNILFYLEAGYFETAAEFKPLIHTWSLAVEEQYYIFFPLLLLAIWRLGVKRIQMALLVLLATSFCLAEWASTRHPDASFFLLPTRLWEILLGGVVALGVNGVRARLGVPGIAQFLSLSGLVLILGAVITYERGLPFPGVYALAPTVGAALVLVFAVPGTMVHAVLSTSAMVWVGLISYSLYLWHQPLLAFAREHYSDDLPGTVIAGILLATFCLSYVSWRFVEQPARRVDVRRVWVFLLGGILAFVLIGSGSVGLYMARADDARSVLESPDGDANAQDVESESGWGEHGICVIEREVTNKKVEACLAVLPAKRVVLFGDSHARTISGPLREQLKEKGVGLVSFLRNGCIPIRNLVRAEIEGEGLLECHEFRNKAVLAIDEIAPDAVILAARWALNIEGPRYDNGEGGVENGPSGRNSVTDDAGNVREGGSVSDHIVMQISKLAERHNVLVVNQIPEAGWKVPRLVKKKLKKESEGDIVISTSYDRYKQRTRSTDQILERLKGRIRVVRADEIVCDAMLPGRCVNYFRGDLYYRDDDHPSPLYGGLIAERIVTALDETVGP